MTNWTSPAGPWTASFRFGGSAVINPTAVGDLIVVTGYASTGGWGSSWANGTKIFSLQGDNGGLGSAYQGFDVYKVNVTGSSTMNLNTSLYGDDCTWIVQQFSPPPLPTPPVYGLDMPNVNWAQYYYYDGTLSYPGYQPLITNDLFVGSARSSSSIVGGSPSAEVTFENNIVTSPFGSLMSLCWGTVSPGMVFPSYTSPSSILTTLIISYTSNANPLVMII